jgi:hypothetical protein
LDHYGIGQIREIGMRQMQYEAERSSSLNTAAWIVLLAAASALTTLALACITPLAAFGTLAAVYMKRTEAIVLMSVVWLTSQVMGFGFLHYPHTISSVAWGAGLLLAALSALMGAADVARRLPRVPAGLRILCCLGAALLLFEVAIFLEGLVLGISAAAFAPHVLFKLIWTNAVTLVALVVLHRVGMSIGLVKDGARTGPQFRAA